MISVNISPSNRLSVLKTIAVPVMVRSLSFARSSTTYRRSKFSFVIGYIISGLFYLVIYRGFIINRYLLRYESVGRLEVDLYKGPVTSLYREVSV